MIDISYADEKYDEYEQEYTEESIPDLEENDGSLKNFPDKDVEYKGSWHILDHVSSMGKSYDYVGLSSKEMRVIKRGAAFTDLETEVDEGEEKKAFRAYWHGQYRLENDDHVTYHENNYVAEYNFIRMIADKKGDISSFTNNNIPGLSDTAFKNMKKKFKNNKINSREWQDVIDNGPNKNKDFLTDLYDDDIYINASDKLKGIYRKCFIYGMALHHVTDTFAHSSFKDNKSIYSLIVHDKKPGDHIDRSKYIYTGADDIKESSNRYTDAKEAAKNVVLAYMGKEDTKEIGIAHTYYSSTFKNKREYYIGKLIYYSLKAKMGTKKDLNSYFTNIDYDADIN